MLEIRIHGRGGQGVKKAAQILGRAAYLSGFKTQDFALYGAERRGAPVVSFVRMDRKGINTRGYVFRPDCVLVLDETIGEAVMEGAKNSYVLVNSHNPRAGCHVVDATAIATREAGSPLGANAALLGAFVAVRKEISLSNLEKAIKKELHGKSGQVIEGNLKSARACHKEMSG